MSNSSPKPEKAPLQPVSTRIRERINQSGQRFHANDNIAAFLEPGDLDALIDEVTGKMKGGFLSGLAMEDLRRDRTNAQTTT